MSTRRFAPATRDQIKAKVGIHGPAGAGKTMLMLQLLHALSPTGKRLVIDTERGRAAKYAGRNGWSFDHEKPTTFSPESLTALLAEAADQGYDAVGIDTWSQYWSGVDGMLDAVNAATSPNKSTFSSGWKQMRPVERRMLDAILAGEFHLVATMRVKTEYLVEPKVIDGRQIMSPSKVGLRPDQRDQFDYEFDLVVEVDPSENAMTVVKTDLETVPHGLRVVKAQPAQFADLVADFCLSGDAYVGPSQFRIRALDDDITVAEMFEIREEVLRRGLAGAPVLGVNGEPTILGDFLTDRVRQLQPRPAVAAARPAAASETAPYDADTADDVALAVDELLTATPDEAKQIQSRLRGTPAGTTDVLPILDDDVIAAVGISQDAARVSLSNFAARVIAFSAKNGPLRPADTRAAAVPA